jgi:plasmid stabilization system protein ParE
MKYSVIIEASARRDIEDIACWRSSYSKDAAREWHQRVKKAIHSLSETPRRCALAPENDAFDVEIRHLLYGRRRYIYRILFTIRGKDVHIFHVRHGAREPLKPENSDG